MRKPEEYKDRFYRNFSSNSLQCFTVKNKESDLLICAEKILKDEAEKFLEKYRKEIEEYIKTDSIFKETLTPCEVPDYAPSIVKDMAEAATIAGVGPMAAVAGAIAEYVGRELLRFSSSVIIENGGDIFLKVDEKKTIGIFAGNSPLSLKVGIEIEPEDTPLGVCTSSGTVGTSLSFGKADAAVIISTSAILADAVATACGNLVKSEKLLKKGIEFAKNIKNIKGAIVIVNDKIGIWGEIKLVNI